jgi:hypothetical protein
MPVTPTLRRLRQEDGELEVIQGYIMKSPQDSNSQLAFMSTY